eukprot:3658526-Prymnesium_polylepis.1
MAQVVRALPRLRAGGAGKPVLRRCSTATGSSDAAKPVLPPTRVQLLRHARIAAVPMFGFGFMDNIIM